MNSLFALALLMAPADLAAIEIEPDVLAETLALDADLAAKLRANGDNPATVRPVDARFEGDRDALAALEQDAADLGWTVVETTEQEDGTFAMDIQRDQTTDDAALSDLTETALRIEAAYGVLYTGWSAPALP